MSYKSLHLLAMLTVSTCAGQTPGADDHIKQLIEHWRWKQYWESTTELGMMYHAGRQFETLLFWGKNQMPPNVGFCSAKLGVCHFYPFAPGNGNSSKMSVPSGEDSQEAFRLFLANSFGEKTLRGRPAQQNIGDYTTTTVKITLPELDPPEAIRDRKRRPRDETYDLIEDLRCAPVQRRRCTVQLMIPFYGVNDPYVPVFRECFGCEDDPKPMIIFMKLVEGVWWHGAMDFSDRPAIVNRVRGQIEKGLMVEVNR